LTAVAADVPLQPKLPRSGISIRRGHLNSTQLGFYSGARGVLKVLAYLIEHGDDCQSGEFRLKLRSRPAGGNRMETSPARAIQCSMQVSDGGQGRNRITDTRIFSSPEHDLVQSKKT